MTTINFDELTRSKVELDPNSILKNGYGLISQEIMRNKNISIQAKAIYSYLCSMAGNDGIAYPTQTLMMDELSMNKSTFNKYLKEILSSGYLKVTQTRKNGKAYKNVYTITMDKRDIEPNRKAYAQIAIKNKKKRPSKQVNNLPSLCHKIYDIDDQCHKKQETEICDSKSNSFKSNIVVVDDIDTNENKIIDLYKSFKLEKRVTPHMTNLLKQYANKFDLMIFEDVFINTLETKPDSNFRYIRHILKTLDSKSIYNFEEYKKDIEFFKENKCFKNKKQNNKKVYSEGSKTKTVNPKTRFHNINQTFNKYGDDELEKMLKESQKGKFEKNTTIEHTEDTDPLKKVYLNAVENNWKNIGTGTYNMAKKYAIKYNKTYKEL